MSARANAYRVAMLLVWLLALPSLALAASGGAGLNPLRGVVTLPGVQAGDATATATGNGITLTARISALLGNQQRFTGAVSPAAAGKTVEIERLGRQTGWVWTPTAHAKITSNGSFAAVWHTNHIGRFAIRAVIVAAARSAAVSPALSVIVYRPAIATWYGPGFYGQTTACGEVLRRSTLGVANRTLPCGTPVAIYYRGRTIIVPVIDRGPYANNADWDLTEATKSAVGMSDTATIGAVSLPKGR